MDSYNCCVVSHILHFIQPRACFFWASCGDNELRRLVWRCGKLWLASFVSGLEAFWEAAGSLAQVEWAHSSYVILEEVGTDTQNNSIVYCPLATSVCGYACVCTSAICIELLTQTFCKDLKIITFSFTPTYNRIIQDSNTRPNHLLCWFRVGPWWHQSRSSRKLSSGTSSVCHWLG